MGFNSAFKGLMIIFLEKFQSALSVAVEGSSGSFVTFLGAFTKLLNATISFVISVRLSVHIEHTERPTGRFLAKLDIGGLF
jgi:hypothetical protein